MTKKKNLGYIVGGVVIGILLIVVVVIQVQNKQKQAELEKELQRIQEEKEFCDSLEISIKPFDITSYGYGIATAGVNYCIVSNKNTAVKSIIILKNGLMDEKDIVLQKGSCMIQGINYWAGYSGSGYHGGVSCDDVASIEIISDICPQVKDIVTDMSEITCGI
ncbi:hypothetical protein KAR52_00170 [Candidatus Pacearchaeota archaeon]|nr:hypothetical protein [Candidatus Pacearchaeota archaeon]